MLDCDDTDTSQNQEHLMQGYEKFKCNLERIKLIMKERRFLLGSILLLQENFNWFRSGTEQVAFTGTANAIIRAMCPLRKFHISFKAVIILFSISCPISPLWRR